jgi:class 3 adenylate cyclase
MKEQKKIELINLINDRFRRADAFVEEAQKTKTNLTTESKQAELPGFEAKQMPYGQFEEKKYAVMMVDVRKSTDIINSPNGTRSMFYIFYVYSALVAKIVDDNNGTSIEFLGDGVLNMFPILPSETEHNSVVRAMKASSEIIHVIQKLLNPELLKRGLSEINVGCGISLGDTIVTRVGYKRDNDLKAFGPCIYEANNIADGFNETKLAPKAKMVIPEDPNGRILLENSYNRHNDFMSYKLTNPEIYLNA